MAAETGRSSARRARPTTIFDAIRQALDRAGLISLKCETLTWASLGSTGRRTSRDCARRSSATWASCPITLENDAYLGTRACAPDADGIAVSAGSGICSSYLGADGEQLSLRLLRRARWRVPDRPARAARNHPRRGRPRPQDRPDAGDARRDGLRIRRGAPPRAHAQGLLPIAHDHPAFGLPDRRVRRPGRGQHRLGLRTRAGPPRDEPRREISTSRARPRSWSRPARCSRALARSSSTCSRAPCIGPTRPRGSV